MQQFKDAALPKAILESLEAMKFTTPTPIQMEAIPPALEGRDVLGSAQTGTGKTAAFGIPLVAHLLDNPKASALVLTPTRELAVQVMETLQNIVGKSRIASALLIGGEAMPKQMQQLRMRPRLIVGTPGRINDHLGRGTLMLHNTSFLVLDETDRMLDMGFGIQLEAISKFLTAKRQTLMFSATLPDNIMKMASKYLSNPVRVSVGSTAAPAAKVSQEMVKVTEEEKYSRLLVELEQRQGSIIVFVKTKYGAEKMAKKLRSRELRVDALHGDLRQNQRDRVIQAFRDQKYRILIATDIAARGLDIPHIEHVINYDLPQAPEDYIHRIGRTARAGAEGQAVNLVTPADGRKWRAIELLMNPNAKPAGSGKSYDDAPRNGAARGKKRPFRVKPRGSAAGAGAGRMGGMGAGKPQAVRGERTERSERTGEQRSERPARANKNMAGAAGNGKARPFHRKGNSNAGNAGAARTGKPASRAA